MGTARREQPPLPEEVDVAIVGSGAGGLAAAITAALEGLSVVVLEKEPYYGGTTARSGGVLWIPMSPHAVALGVRDSLDAARTYLRHEAGAAFDGERVDAFLDNAARMVQCFEARTAVQFEAMPSFSDYHPDAPGGLPGGRSLVARPYTAGALGARAAQLRPPLREITFVGMMFNASREVSHFFEWTRSLESAVYVVKRLAHHAWEMARHGRAQRLTNGNALAARLARSAFDLGVSIVTGTPALRLLKEGSRVTGVVVDIDGHPTPLRARRGVVLAAGGFAQDPGLRKRLFPHAPTGAEHWSPSPPGNTGDGWRMAEAAGGQTNTALSNAAAWIPVSRVTHRDGTRGVFPHLIDRYKPGVIMVNARGERFVNEADSYHDVGQAMQQQPRIDGEAAAFLVTDHRAIRRYGLGFVKPFPLPLWTHLRSGYLMRGASLRELGQRLGVDGDRLEATVREFNEGARDGHDRQFGRGETAYNRCLGDARQAPNPCVAPIETGPYYAVKVLMGDLGTFAGIRTNASAQVLDARGAPIDGLYAVGNDAASVMGGAYPGGGITLGPAMTFGFIAGRHLAARAAAERAAPDEEKRSPRGGPAHPRHTTTGDIA